MCQNYSLLIPRNNLFQVAVDTDIKCDLALESVRVLLQNLNVFVSETRSTPFTRVEILKAQILYEEVGRNSDVSLSFRNLSQFYCPRLAV